MGNVDICVMFNMMSNTKYFSQNAINGFIFGFQDTVKSFHFLRYLQVNCIACNNKCQKILVCYSTKKN